MISPSRDELRAPHDSTFLEKIFIIVVVDCTHTWKVKDVKAASNSNLVQLTRSSSQYFILFIGGA